ncbi:MAG: COX15/CtaA family protein [Acidobacteriia bacterium]|nr:COX15/CtaA family protein [Terriglobia bacterium]
MHRYAVVVAICVLILIAVGAYITSEAVAPQQAPSGMLHAPFHTAMAVVVGILALGLAIWQSLAKEGFFLGWAAVGFIVIDGWVGWLGWPVVHASLAALAFAIVVAIAVVTSSVWNAGPEFVDGQAAPLLRPLAIAAPPLVLLQIVFGAAYRHKATGIMPHMGGAMIAALTTLVAASLVMQQYPQHRPLRSAAIWLLSIVLLQVTLGVTAFTMQLLELENSVALVIAATSHVVVGSLTLAASLVLAMQVQRNMRRAVAGATAGKT